jgi:hypothetical protein
MCSGTCTTQLGERTGHSEVPVPPQKLSGSALPVTNRTIARRMLTFATGR